MGTSVEMIDRTYGHLAPDAEDYERLLLDAYDAKTEKLSQPGLGRSLTDLSQPAKGAIVVSS